MYHGGKAWLKSRVKAQVVVFATDDFRLTKRVECCNRVCLTASFAIVRAIAIVFITSDVESAICP